MNNTSRNEIVKGSIGKYNNHTYSVKSIRGGKANLTGVFQSRIVHKGVAVNELVDDYEAWQEAWENSEAYQCM